MSDDPQYLIHEQVKKAEEATVSAAKKTGAVVEEKSNKVGSWIDRNRVLAGAIGGFAAGTVVPGVGNVIGAIVGAGIGWVSAQEKKGHQ